MLDKLGFKAFFIILTQLNTHGSLRYRDLKKTTKIPPDTLVRKLKDLAALHLVKRKVGSDRSVSYGITAKGRECLRLLSKLNKLFQS